MTGRNLYSQTIQISIWFFVALVLIAAGDYFLNPDEFEFKVEHIFVALVPFIILLVLSGKLKEIKGPGGIALSLQDEAKKTVSPDREEEPLLVPMAEVLHKGNDYDFRRQIAVRPPSTFAFQIGRGYSEKMIADMHEELTRFPNYRFVLFIDDHGRFLGGMKPEYFSRILYESNIVDMIESGNILESEYTIRNSVTINVSNKQALDEMERNDLNLLPVLDNNNVFYGLITQEEIVRKVLTKVLREV